MKIIIKLWYYVRKLLIRFFSVVKCLFNKNMSYKEAISLTLENQTNQTQKIGLLGGLSSTYANSNNTVVVEWDLTGESFGDTTVVLGTTVPVEEPLLTASISGVVDALNLMNKGVFLFEGSKVYATSLLDDSVKTANLTLQSGTFIPQTVTFRFSDTTPDTAIGKYNIVYTKQLFSVFTSPVTKQVYIADTSTFEAGTQLYKDANGSAVTDNNSLITQPNVTTADSITTVSNGKITGIVPLSTIRTSEINLVTQSSDISTVTKTLGGLDSNSQVLPPTMSTNGLYLILWDSVNARLLRYTLSTAFDVTTINETPDQNVAFVGTTSQSITWSANGSTVILFDDDNTGTYLQWDLSSAWDLTTIVSVTTNSGITGDSSSSWNPTGEFLLRGQLNGNLTGTTFTTPFTLENTGTNSVTVADSSFLTTTPSGQKIQTQYSYLGGRFYYVYSGGTIIQCSISATSPNLNLVSENASTTQASTGYALKGIILNPLSGFTGYYGIFQSNTTNAEFKIIEYGATP